MTGESGRVGIELVTALGLAPVRYVEAAAALDCAGVSLALEPIARLSRLPHWSLRDDAAQRRDVRRALAYTGASLALGEGLLVHAAFDREAFERDLDLFSELGAKAVNLLPIDGDRSRLIDSYAARVDIATARDIDVVMEFMPVLPVATLADAKDIVAALGRPRFRMLLDSMHVFRSGATVEDIAALDPGTIGYVQICDVPWAVAGEGYAEEARSERLLPGAGALPLPAFVRALPPGVPIGAEMPMMARGEAGEDPVDLMRAALNAVRDLVDANRDDPS